MRLIDADNYKDVLYAKRNNPSIRNGIASAITMLGKQETIDAVPVVHGRWVRVYEHDADFGTEVWTKCSQCNKRGRSDANYCPNCGAYMRGE